MMLSRVKICLGFIIIVIDFKCCDNLPQFLRWVASLHPVSYWHMSLESMQAPLLHLNSLLLQSVLALKQYVNVNINVM